MGKFCSNCGKELDDNADICLKCGVLVNGNKSNVNVVNTKKGLPAWAIVLIVLGTLFLLFIGLLFSLGLLAYNTVRTSPEVEEYGSDIRDIEDDIEGYVRDYIEEYNGNTTVVGEGTVGDTILIDNIKITLLKTDNYTYNGDGYLIFFFVVENGSNSDKLISYLNFRGIVDGEEVSSSFMLGKIDDVGNLNKNVKSGEKVNGYVAFEAPDNWEKFDLRYRKYLTNNEIVFSVINEKENESV